jgi:uncharacterized repeat protein (TIGR01451 family)
MNQKRMDQRQGAMLLAVGVALLVCVALAWSAVPVAAGPVAQVTITPRPKLTPTPGVSETKVQSARHTPRLHGTVLDWGKGNMPAGVQVVLSGSGWSVPVETDAAGEYVFRDMGNEVAFLNAVVPDDRGELVPLAVDLPVRIDVNGELVVNLAFYPEDLAPDPLIHMEVVSSSPEAAPDENVSFVITVVNDWSEGINQVIVADYLPDGLIYGSASASQGSVVFDRGLVWAELGPMAPGSSATVTIIVKVSADAEPGTLFANAAAAYHSENAAVQQEVSLRVVEHSNGVLPVTGLTSTLPIAGAFLVGLLIVVRRLHRTKAEV